MVGVTRQKAAINVGNSVQALSKAALLLYQRSMAELFVSRDIPQLRRSQLISQLDFIKRLIDQTLIQLHVGDEEGELRGWVDHLVESGDIHPELHCLK